MSQKQIEQTKTEVAEVREWSREFKAMDFKKQLEMLEPIRHGNEFVFEKGSHDLSRRRLLTLINTMLADGRLTQVREWVFKLNERNN